MNQLDRNLAEGTATLRRKLIGHERCARGRREPAQPRAGSADLYSEEGQPPLRKGRGSLNSHTPTMQKTHGLPSNREMQHHEFQNPAHSKHKLCILGYHRLQSSPVQDCINIQSCTSSKCLSALFKVIRISGPCIVLHVTMFASDICFPCCCLHRCWHPAFALHLLYLFACLSQNRKRANIKSKATAMQKNEEQSTDSKCKKEAS